MGNQVMYSEEVLVEIQDSLDSSRSYMESSIEQILKNIEDLKGSYSNDQLEVAFDSAKSSIAAFKNEFNGVLNNYKDTIENMKLSYAESEQKNLQEIENLGKNGKYPVGTTVDTHLNADLGSHYGTINDKSIDVYDTDLDGYPDTYIDNKTNKVVEVSPDSKIEIDYNELPYVGMKVDNIVDGRSKWNHYGTVSGTNIEVYDTNLDGNPDTFVDNTTNKVVDYNRNLHITVDESAKIDRTVKKDNPQYEAKQFSEVVIKSVDKSSIDNNN